MKKPKVLIAMSGGLDSTMSAYLLKMDGYEVIGLTMKTWDYAASGGTKKETGCCSLDSINDARAIAVQYDFPHIIVDMKTEFGDAVIDDFIDQYASAKTPNPCIMCNIHMKWGVLLNKAKQLGCEFIATGHYAKIINHPDGRLGIGVADDLAKDQSYVLWGLKQEVLARTIFPLGSLIKTDVRAKAKELGWDLYNKPDSYEICFIPDNDYRGFIKRKRPDLIKPGHIKSLDGTILADHDGLFNFTVGQRRGMGISGETDPLYVTKLDPKTNTVWVGPADAMKSTIAYIRNPVWHSIDKLDHPMIVKARIRSMHKGAMAEISMDGDRVRLQFVVGENSLTPGQSAVFYNGTDVIGGGFIDSVE
jgi:tRNA-specific 2-thiouridylase